MTKIVLDREQMKKCPFCHEIIRIEAVKCRFCAEFLDTKEAQAIQNAAAEKASGPVLFEGRPSLFALVGTGIKTAFFLLTGAVLMSWPIEELANRIFNIGLSDNLLDICRTYRVLAALGLWVSVTFF